MALVRRVDIMGPPAERRTGPQTFVPQGNAPIGVATVPPPGGADAPPSSITGAVPAWAANAEAAAVASKGAGVGTVAIGFARAAIVAATAYALNKRGNHAEPSQIANQTSASSRLSV